MASKYLLEISAAKGYLTEDAVKVPLSTGVEHRFKVQGEGRVVAVVTDCVDKVASDVVTAAEGNNTVHTKCIPLIPYEGFAQSSLGVKEGEVEKKGKTPAFDPEKETYWVQVDINYGGRTLEELVQAWHDEAVAALGLVHGGQLPIMLYKTVFVKQVHLFVQMPAAALDQLQFQLPMFKAMGDQVKTTTRRVKLF